MSKSPFRLLLVASLLSAAATHHTLAAQVLAPAKVPAAVQAGYARKFPGSRKTEWKRKNDGAYEAEFDLRGVSIAAKFDSTGAWLETESDITAAQVPAAVMRAVTREFKGYRVIERQTLEPRAGPTLYELHLQNAKETIKAQLDSAGRTISKSAKPR